MIARLLLELAAFGGLVLAIGGLLGAAILATIPGAGGQVPPRPDQQTQQAQPVPVSPGGGQIIARKVTIIGSGGELLVYSPAAAAGDLIASIAGMSFTDSFGNTGPEGIAADVHVAGDLYYIQLGEGSWFGTLAGGIFMHNISHPPANDPSLLGLASTTGGGSLLLSSGGGTQSGIQISDATASGTAAGEILFSTGQVSLNTSAVTTIPTALSGSIITVPHNPNDPTYGGAGGLNWISGERLVLDNQIDDINANFSAIVTALRNVGICT